MRHPGIEPGASRWQRDILPLNQQRTLETTFLDNLTHTTLQNRPHTQKSPHQNIPSRFAYTSSSHTNSHTPISLCLSFRFYFDFNQSILFQFYYAPPHDLEYSPHCSRSLLIAQRDQYRPLQIVFQRLLIFRKMGHRHQAVWRCSRTLAAKFRFRNESSETWHVDRESLGDLESPSLVTESVA